MFPKIEKVLLINHNNNNNQKQSLKHSVSRRSEREIKPTYHYQEKIINDITFNAGEQDKKNNSIIIINDKNEINEENQRGELTGKRNQNYFSKYFENDNMKEVNVFDIGSYESNMYDEF